MPVLTEGKHACEGVLSEASGNRSRDEITVASGSGVIAAMTVLGLYTSGANAGKYGPSPAAAADPDVGNQAAKAVCLYGVDATAADVKVAALTRDCEVIGGFLTYEATVDTAPEITAKAAQLAAVGIIVR
ncbi:MAG: hypothetical protein RL299_1917 [Pseudomonadota bacterium]|jgi:hypothetical protein